MPLICGWGRHPTVSAEQSTFDSDEALRSILTTPRLIAGLIPRGLGRSYGDSSLSERVISTKRMNRLISFDKTTGVLVCEGGVSIAEVLDIFVPRAWFVPVTPGTKYVTIGGAIASDVHGKNHHRSGSFSNHVLWVDVALSDGSIVRCSQSENRDLFLATCAGYGLTGVILRAAVRLVSVESAFIRQRTIRAHNLEEAMTIFEENSSWTYSVAWIDTLSSGREAGRSVIMLGEHAKAEEVTRVRGTRAGKSSAHEPLVPRKSRRLSVPFDLPSFVLNSLVVSTFNYFYYHKSPRLAGEKLVSYEPFFYPLDGILNWNRIYGRRGFTQYQLVLPKESSKEGLKEVLRLTSGHGNSSFLAVLKLFGKEDSPYLSFAREGYTLSLDFPITKDLFQQLDELDAVVLAYGGRLYATKDCRMSAGMFRSGYPEVDKFIEVRERVDPDRRFASLQSRRLGL